MQPPKREPLGKKHDRVAFSCEDDALDTYLKKRASQEAKKKIATPFVMADSRTSGLSGFTHYFDEPYMPRMVDDGVSP